MGLFDKVKKSSRTSKNQEKMYAKSTNKIIIDNNIEYRDSNEYDSSKIIEDHFPQEKIRNFKFLDELIHCGAKEIVLNYNVILSEEEFEYQKGIKLDVDGLVIKGNGHVIDAGRKARIFSCSGKNIVIENIILKNGCALRGGAINNDGGNIKMNSCEFKDNVAQMGGGAILNSSEITLINTVFNTNSSLKDNGGAIYNNGGYVKIKDCEFKNNVAQKGGGAIINWGQITIEKTVFYRNSTQKLSGGAINNEKGIIKIDECKFNQNTAQKNGGALLNFGKITLTKTVFCKNIAKRDGGVIKNFSGGVLGVFDCEFKLNGACIGSGIYNDADDVKLIKCIFSNHSLNNVIFNTNKMDIVDCSFKDNEKLDCVIFSEEGSRLNMSGGEIKYNNIKKSTLYTKADECNLSNTIFKYNNSYSIHQSGEDVFNEGKLCIQSPKITRVNAIVNQGHIDVRKLHHGEVERIIKNIGDASIDEFNIPSEYKFDFSYLNGLIQKNDDVISLKNDICLENYELDFYEGGIGLDKDNLIIDGQNHIIDGKNKTRIFYVMGKNVVLKNIIFKNGAFINTNNEQFSGGGAIKIVKDASLIIKNCQFIDNSSHDDGGAIQNNGTLYLDNNKFINNSSRYNGGAICNNNIAYSTDDYYEDNASKIAGAIYNNHKLIIKNDISLINNQSDINKDIYNVNYVKTENMNFNVQKRIFNTYIINNDENTNEWQTFQYLNKKLNDSELDENIKIVFKDIDEDLILLSNIEFNGNGHIIDLNNVNINFKIKKNVIVRNITFKNASISKNSLFEIEGEMKFVNVNFLNNKISRDCCLFNNKGKLKFIDSKFYNNKSKNNALINNNHNLEIHNSAFINNHSNSQGSIIYNASNNNKKVFIKNSSFKYNSTKDGGTIYNNQYSSIEIINSEFIKNTAKIHGGAIYNFGQIIIEETIFDYNKTQEQDGGAINNQLTGDLKINTCKFRRNVAKKGGGAIINFGKIILDGTLFSKNKTKEDNGGAVNNQMSGVLEALNVCFNHNLANVNGGAIYNMNENNLNLKNCKFNDNKPDNVN